MKIMKLTKLHSLYLLNRIFFIIFFLLNILLIFYFLIISKSMEEFVDRFIYQSEYYDLYYNSGIGILKIILPIIVIYISGNSILENNDNYKLVLIKNKIDKVKYYLTKVFSINIISSMLIIIVYIYYLLIGSIFVINFDVVKIVDVLFYIYVLCLIYSNLSMIVTKFSSKSIGYIFLIICYIINDGLNSYNPNSANMLTFILPIIQNSGDGYNLIFGFSHICIILIFYNIFSFLVYYIKDI